MLKTLINDALTIGALGVIVVTSVPLKIADKVETAVLKSFN